MPRACPICKRSMPEPPPAADGTPPPRPFGAFCSERCRKIDLAAWLDGAYRISRPLAEEDLDAGPANPTNVGDESSEPRGRN